MFSIPLQKKTNDEGLLSSLEVLSIDMYIVHNDLTASIELYVRFNCDASTFGEREIKTVAKAPEFGSRIVSYYCK